MDCDRLQEYYAEYALGVLEGSERDQLAEHLARQCPVCTPGVGEAQSLVSHLAFVAPSVAPPESVRSKLMAEIKSKNIKTISMRRQIIPVWAWAGAAAAMLLLSIATVQQSRSYQKQAQTLQAQLKDLTTENETYRRALSIAAAAGAKSISLTSTQPQAPQLRAYWSEDDGLLLTARNMPALRSGRTYQLWVVPKQGSPASAGLFQPDASGGVLLLSGPGSRISEAAALAITDEPSGGSPQPTMTPIWVGPLS